MRSLMVVLFVLAFRFVGNAQIINFPDANFKNALVNTKCVDTDNDGYGDADADFNNDGEVDLDEALKVDSLYLIGRQIKNLEGIHNFESLKLLDCIFNELTSLNVQGLENLLELDCSLNNLTLLNVQGLKSLKNIHCIGNKLTSLNVQGLENLLGLYCGGNQLEFLNLLDLKNLEYLVCDKNQITILNVQGLINLKGLICNNNKLTSLNLKGLTNLKSLYCPNNQLISLNVEGLTNLDYISCGDNQLTTLNVQYLTKLRRLTCEYNKLNSLNLDGLTNLEDLYCNNNELTFLNIKENKRSIFLNYFKFYGNPNLSYICCKEFEINFIKYEAIKSGQNIEVNSYCSFTPGGRFYILNGENTFDSNNDGCDAQDTKLSYIKYKITNGIHTANIISNQTGNYAMPVQEGTHTITPILENPNHFEVSPSSFTISFPSASDTITQDFCITPKGIFRQTNITVIPLSPPARPGFDAQYKIVWENAGNQIESGTLNFTYDETRLDYISATLAADIVSDGIVKWNFSDLRPFEKREIIVTLKINKPTDTPAVNSGDKLYLNASILDNIFTLENTVVCSYDPNDKTCLQGERIHPDQIGKYVDFLIRFENTGNYAAENIVVKDIIDTKRFDVSSLQITDASHEVYARIEDNKVEFIFEKIQLPFDDANNDGYIAFKIKTLPTLMVGDSLKNLADIYFDYNFPIRTNETKSKLAFPVGTKDEVKEVKVYPNPVSDILTLEIKDDIINKVEIYDTQGRIIRSSSIINNQINVSDLEQGSYVSKVHSQKGIGWVRFVKI